MAGTTAVTLIVMVQALVLTPSYLSAAGSRLYGAWLASGDLLVWMYAFDLGLGNLLIQRIGSAHGRDDRREIGEYLAAGLTVLGGVAAIVGLAGAVLASGLPGWMGLDGEEAATLRGCFLAASAATAVGLFNQGFVGFSRGIQVTGFINVVGVVAALCGFGVAAAVLHHGYGLWAVPAGLAARVMVQLAGGVWFVWAQHRGPLSGLVRLRAAVVTDVLRVSPATTLGGLAYAAMNSSDSVLVALTTRPELAAVYTLTRRGIDMARSVVEMIGFASYGSFAHLVASADRHRALEVQAEVRALRTSAATAAAVVFLAINPSLVAAWVGPEQFGGLALTALLAAQFIVVGDAYLMNYLYRAAGPVEHGSLLLVAEALVRVPLMWGLLSMLGLVGVPLAAIVTAAVAGSVAARATRRHVAGFAPLAKSVPLGLWALRLSLLAGATASGALWAAPSWQRVAVLALASGGCAVVLLWFADVRLRGVVQPWLRVPGRRS